MRTPIEACINDSLKSKEDKKPCYDELEILNNQVNDYQWNIINQDPNAPIVVCGDFNNHMTYIAEQLGPLNFTAALEPSTETHNQGGHLD